MAACPRRQAGFTMIEMLVVMVIMGLAFSLVPPLFSSGQSATEIKAAARKLAAGLRQARSEAVASRQERALLLDVEQRRFVIGGNPREYRLPAGIGLNLFTAQTERQGEHAGTIRFYPDGSSTGGRITVGRDGGQQYKVDVDWLTGRVAILD